METPIKNIIQKVTKDNTFLTISGSNNSGKTTLIRILDKKLIERKIETIIPFEILPLERTLDEELYQLDSSLEEKEKIIKKLKLNKILKKEWKDYSKNEIVLSQLAIALLKKPKILLIDDLTAHINKETRQEIINLLIEYHKKNECSIILTTRFLEDTMKSDYLYILNEGEVVISGKPMEILEKDNILNKYGLSLPFMMDLSVKLRDYSLIEDIELDMKGLVNTLWK